jgi:hypothetical protein
MSFTASVLVEPGTIILDDRFGRRVVRGVEATVSNGSVTGTLMVSESTPEAGAVSELVGGLAELAIEATRARFGRFYEYRVIAMAGDRVEAQAVHPLVDGVPDILPLSVWAGASGYRAKLTPASRVLIGFVAGDPRQPFVAFYEPPEVGGWRALEVDIDATGLVSIGEQAEVVTLGGAAGALPIARVTPALATWITAITTYVNGIAPGTAVAPTDLASSKVVAS